MFAEHGFKKWMSFNSSILRRAFLVLKASKPRNTDEPFELEEDSWYGFVSIAGHRGWLLYGWTQGPLERNGRVFERLRPGR